MIKKSLFAKALLLLTLGLLLSCSTKKNTFTTRAYHNLTAKYNVYFNSNEALTLGEQKILDTYKFNFTQVLPVLLYSDKNATSLVSADMDKAIKKAEKTVKKHSLTVKPKKKASKKKKTNTAKERKKSKKQLIKEREKAKKAKAKAKKKGKKYEPKDTEKANDDTVVGGNAESVPLVVGADERKKMGEVDFNKKPDYCNWIDDAYLVMGKAEAYKQDYDKSIEALDFLIKKFSMYPIKYDAYVWMARVYIGQEDFSGAKVVLDQLSGDRELPLDLDGDLAATYAHLFVQQKRYTEAVPWLQKAIEKTKNKKDRVRYKYILAQIYQKQENGSAASKQFAEVVDDNPPYEMAFAAKINMARSFTSGSSGSESIRKELVKMLSDDKNIDYRDQIYFALAELEQKDNRMSKAIEYYRLSTITSVNNNDQKAVSFLALADIYFEIPDYDTSQVYYDSTMSFLSAEYENYEAIEIKTKNLTDLVVNLKEVILQDSLLRLANMSEAQRNALVNNIIRDLEQEEQRKKQEAELAKKQFYDVGMDDMTGTNRYSAGKGKWLFYNPQTLSASQSEFYKKWGRRKLEDNWRRRNKKIVIPDLDDELLATSDSQADTLSKKNPQFYLRNIPLTDSAKIAAHGKITKALYNAGLVYKDKLVDYPSSIEQFERLNKRYPKSAYELENYYNLYLLNKELNKTGEADMYKRKIIAEYPNSRYALAFTNPDYLKKLMADMQQAETDYMGALNAYEKGAYSQVISKADMALAAYKNDDLNPKFMYLKALSVGELNKPNVEQYREELNKVVKAYPKSEVAQVAVATLKVLQNSKVVQSAKTEYAYDRYPDVEKIFKEEVDGEPHFFVICLKNKRMDSNKAKFNLSRYNLDNYTNVVFTVKDEDLGDNQKLITVTPFTNKAIAEEYYNKVAANSNAALKGLPANQYDIFVVTETNLNLLRKELSTAKYLHFFQKFYLQKKG